MNFILKPIVRFLAAAFSDPDFAYEVGVKYEPVDRGDPYGCMWASIEENPHEPGMYNVVSVSPVATTTFPLCDYETARRRMSTLLRGSTRRFR